VTVETWLWIGTVGMLLGAVVLALLGKRRTQDEEGHTLLHVFVTLVAAGAYFAMAVGQGDVRLADGRVLLFARYVDWSITTPLLLLGLAMTALHGAHRRPGLVAALLGADVLMILTGLFFSLSTEPFPKWTWYIASCFAFLAVCAVLVGPLRREAADRPPERRSAYGHDVAVLAVLWLLYPVVVLLGPDGLGVWSEATHTGSLTVIDLLAKVGYGLLTIAGAARIATAELARGEVKAKPVESPAVPSSASGAA